jgi:hypothetical protein
MKIKAMNGVARILKTEGVNWISCYPTSPINNALGEEGVPIYMMGEERFGIAVADAYSRITCGRQIGVCTAMAGLNAAGIQMAYGAIDLADPLGDRLQRFGDVEMGMPALSAGQALDHDQHR